MPSSLPADRATVDASYAFEAMARQAPQELLVQVPILHTLHGGVYTRTSHIPAGTAITSVLIKIETTLVVHGDFLVLRIEDGRELWDLYQGTQVFAADAGRRMVYVAKTDVVMTMVFPTSAKTVAEAEAEFTDEVHLLQSSGGVDDVVINTHKEEVCQV